MKLLTGSALAAMLVTGCGSGTGGQPRHDSPPESFAQMWNQTLPVVHRLDTHPPESTGSDDVNAAAGWSTDAVYDFEEYDAAGSPETRSSWCVVSDNGWFESSEADGASYRIRLGRGDCSHADDDAEVVYDGDRGVFVEGGDRMEDAKVPPYGS